MTGNKLDRLLVVKLGGGEGLDLDAACDDLAELAGQRPLVVVHGVSAAMNQMCQDLGIAVQSLTSPTGHSSRYTPPSVRDVYVKAAEQVNARLLSALRRRGVAAVGMTGEDIVLQAERKPALRAVVKGRIRIIRDDCSGRIKNVAAEALRARLQQGQVPVLPPMAASADGLLNVDGDRASAATAGALNANTLLILSNVRGLYRDFPDEKSFISEVPPAQMEGALQAAQGRMKRKVIAAGEALQTGTRTVIIADGRTARPASQALAGAGTRFSL